MYEFIAIFEIYDDDYCTMNLDGLTHKETQIDYF